MKSRFSAALAATFMLTTSASAADFSFAGVFAQDNDKAIYNFTLAAPGTVTLTSLGYAGGANLAGQMIARGGFDPVFSLYDANGLIVGFNTPNPDGSFDGFNDDGVGVPLDSVTGVGADSKIMLALGAGSYALYLTQYSNFGPIDLTNPFPFDGEPNFRGGFIDGTDDQRTSRFALDIAGVTSAAAVPEPASWAFMLLGFGAIGGAVRSRRRVTAIRFA
jgi:hypothetical protein